jgi:hypothetical protein
VLPVHPDTRDAARPLTPNQPTLMRLEIMPFDHVFGAGSSLRLTIDAPTGTTNGDAFRYFPTPSMDTVFHTRAMPSAVVFGTVGGGTQLAPEPSCSSAIMGEPCRANPAPIPPGALTLP